MEPITVDFETEAIRGNPLVDPPRPVGVAVWVQGQDPWYAPISPDIVDALRGIWQHDMLFHNAPFDLSVANRWLDLPWPAWDAIHDTQYLVFHYNPYGKLALKPAAEEILGLPPEEQDYLREWILANVPEAKASDWGAYISQAPIELVRPYAIGDVVRTYKLFDFLQRQRLYNAEPIRS